MALNLQVENAISATAQTVKDQNGNTGPLTLSVDKVAIGTISPKTKLDVAGNVQILTGSNPIRFTDGWTAFPDAVTNQAEISNDTSFFKTLMIVGNKSAGLGRRVSVWARLEVFGTFITMEGNVGIGTTAPREKLEVNGNIVTNGDIRLTNADCAEDFDICETEQVEPGTVMVLGEEGVLYPSQQPYDKRVAGVVSGAGGYKPGIVLDRQESDNVRKPIALVGKVFCKVDARYGAIEVGDLLTTSPTPGHGMRADEPLKRLEQYWGKPSAH